jgi:heptosyltransferase-2
MKILVIGPSWVGDMMMSQSLYRTLRARYPQAIIDVMAPAWCRPLLSRMPEVNEAIPMPLGHGAGNRRTPQARPQPARTSLRSRLRAAQLV